jgi:hypothetical protein
MRDLCALRSWTLAVCSVAVLALNACHADRSSGPLADANSNWLSYCKVNADCRSDGACICGLCTVTCQANAQCARSNRPTSCVSPVGASGQEVCAAIVQNSGQQICLPDCASDADCAAGSGCTQGACWPRPPSVVDLRDAGQDANMTTTRQVIPPPLGIDASMEIARYDAAVSFETPTMLSLPEVRIQSTPDAPSLLGVWEQIPETSMLFAGPLRLEIRDSAVDGTSGTLSFQCAPGHCDPTGPVEPATDPSVGYPPELAPREQDLLRANVLPRYAYRIFDGRITADGFRFWFTNSDLWRDWCKLQTAYPVRVQDRSEYSCLPDAKTLDELGMQPDATGKQWLCASDYSVCRCDADGCSMNPHTSAHDIDLIRDGDTLQGFLSIGDTFSVTLRRTASVAP